MKDAHKSSTWRVIRAPAIGLLWMALNVACAADAPVAGERLILKRGDCVAMAGDSITYMSRYSMWVEMYLLAARPDLDLRAIKIQRGCGGSAERYVLDTLEQELIPTKPNVVTICFGMNDGGGQAPNAETEGRYGTALTRIVERCQANGITPVLCSPGVVDLFSYENATLAAATYNAANGMHSDPAEFKANASALVYNRTLAGLRDVARRVAEAHKVPFADIHDAMWQVMQAGIAGYGKTWPPRASTRWPGRKALICEDGIHPDVAAHIPMAYAVLKAMGFDGDIGRIELDWNKGTVQTDPAQRAKVSSRGRIEMESTRIPMVFLDDTASGGGYPSVPCRYVLQHCPFNEDLNRYMLKVNGLPNQSVRVTWGDRSLVFTREQLEAGINLAAEFVENPFCPAMRELDKAVYFKQVFERSIFEMLNVPIWKEFYGNWNQKDLHSTLDQFCKWATKEFPDNRELLDACEGIRVRACEKNETIKPAELQRIRELLSGLQREYHQRARAAIKPVRHIIIVEPL